MNKLLRLDWDSHFFKINIAKVNFSKKNISESSCLKNKSFIYDLIYIFSKNDISDYLSLNPIDIKIVYSKKVTFTSKKTDKNIISYRKEINNDLLNLAYTAGNHSRFKIDSHLNNKFADLYRLWLEKSISREITNEFFTYSIDKKIVGFVTCKIHNKELEIGLIAVSNFYQGKGIGKKLLAKVNFYAKKNNILNIIVATQLHNKNACAFYEKNDYKVSTKTYIYHLWKK